MAVLVVAEHDNSSIKDATHKVVSAAAAMGGDVDVLVAGVNAGAAAQAAAKISGVRKVLHADGASLAKQMAEPLEALIVPLMANYGAVLFAASTSGKNAAVAFGRGACIRFWHPNSHKGSAVRKAIDVI